ncbi:MAG: porin family protein [Bacteroidota bacterium]
MKLKKLLLIVFVLFTVSNSQAQKWHFGLKASPTLAWLKVDTKGIEADGSKLAFSWGFMAEYYFADNYAIASGVDLGGYGGKTTIANSVVLINENLNLHYIDLPISIKMRTNEISYMRYFGQFGFTPGVNILAKEDKETTIAGFGKEEEDEIDIKSDIFPLNVSLLIALGAEYSLSGNTSLVMSVSFHNGFINIAENEISDPTPSNQDNTKSVKVTTNAVRLNVGILF